MVFKGKIRSVGCCFKILPVLFDYYLNIKRPHTFRLLSLLQFLMMDTVRRTIYFEYNMIK